MHLVLIGRRRAVRNLRVTHHRMRIVDVAWQAELLYVPLAESAGGAKQLACALRPGGAWYMPFAWTYSNLGSNVTTSSRGSLQRQIVMRLIRPGTVETRLFRLAPRLKAAGGTVRIFQEPSSRRCQASAKAILAAVRAASFSCSVQTLRSRMIGALISLTGPPPSTGRRMVEVRAASECHW